MNSTPDQSAEVPKVAKGPGNAPANDLSLLNEDLDDAPHKERRRWPWLLIVIILAIAGGGYYWVRKGNAAPAPAYNTVEVARGDITQVVTANGQITPVKTVTVGSQVSGMIIELMADYNSQVTNGQVIAQLDPSTYQQSLVQAEAELASANAALTLAEVNLRRAKALQEIAANPQSELDTADAQFKQAQAATKVRQAAVNKARVDLERTTIYSPIDGLVISRAVDVGQTVAASLNAPTLFTIAKDLREMHIEAAVSEADVGGVKEGQEVRFSVDAFPNNVFHGDVSQLRFEPRTNQNVVSYVTVVDLRNDDLRLRPGMTANASIITAEREGVIRIPNAALRFRPPEAAGATAASAGATQGQRSGTAARSGQSSGQGNSERPSGGSGEQRRGAGARGGRGDSPGAQTRMVYVLATDSSGTSTLKPVTIKTGASDSTWTEVIEGLKEGDVVVTGLKQQMAQTQSARPGGGSPFGGGGMRGPR